MVCENVKNSNGEFAEDFVCTGAGGDESIQADIQSRSSIDVARLSASAYIVTLDVRELKLLVANIIRRIRIPNA